MDLDIPCKSEHGVSCGIMILSCYSKERCVGMLTCVSGGQTDFWAVHRQTEWIRFIVYPLNMNDQCLYLCVLAVV